MTVRELWMEALGVAGAPARGRLTTCFRLAGDVFVDTGAAAHGADAVVQAAPKTLLLTHAHLDHTLGLPFLLGCGPLHVCALRQTIDAVRESLLDDRIWPDLSHLASWTPLGQGASIGVPPWEVETHASRHGVPCLSYAFRAEGEVRLVVVGDTILDEDLVAWVAGLRPRYCAVECSYPDAEAEFARTHFHQTPQDLAVWREGLGDETTLLVYHLKPLHEAQLRRELDALGDGKLAILADGDRIDLS